MNTFLLRDFLRSKSLVAGIVLLLFAGLLSLYIGNLFLDQQEQTTGQTAEAQVEGIGRTLDFVAEDDIGLFLYHARFGLVNETPRISGLSIGHRDMHPAAQNVNIRNLEEQRHVSVLKNPFFQFLGNLDFSFVLIYFFPLVIIAFCFNLFSEEEEGGTWRLVLSQLERPERVLYGKLVVRLGAVALILTALLVIGKFVLRIPLDSHFLAFSVVSMLYVAFWFALSWLVIRLRRSSNQNALILLLAWVMLTIVVPSSLNTLVVGLYPVPEAYEAMLDSRDGYHNKWDEPIGPTLEKFQAIYPQFAAYQHPEGEAFSWLWYYAMQQMGDAEAATASAAMRDKLKQRDDFSKVSGYLFPSVHALLGLNALTHSDLTNYLAFQDRLAGFHERMRLEFYPAIFSESAVSSVNWNQYGTDYFRDDRPVNWLAVVLPLMLPILLLLGAARVFGMPYGAM
ncbi:MAG: DUF3526 domain-containing protein [Lewinella sp.]